MDIFTNFNKPCLQAQEKHMSHLQMHYRMLQNPELVRVSSLFKAITSVSSNKIQIKKQMKSCPYLPQ